MVRLAVFVVVGAVCVWQLAAWITQGRKRPEYGTRKYVIMLANNVGMWAVVLVFAARGLVFGDLWELLLVPIAVLVIFHLTNIAEWWMLDVGNQYGDVSLENEARSAFRLVDNVIPVQLAGFAANFALLGTAAHITRSAQLQFVFWTLAVVFAAAWILSVIVAALARSAKRRRVVASEPETYALGCAQRLVGGLAQSGFLRRPFVTRARFGPVVCALFADSMMLGRLYRDRAVLFSPPYVAGNAPPEEIVERMRKLGAEIGARNPDATTVFELVATTMMADDPSATGDWIEWLRRTADSRLSLRAATLASLYYCMVGAGFGMEYPDRTIDIVVSSYGEIGAREWAIAFDQGLVSIPEQGDISFARRERDAREGFAVFVRARYPELVEALGLEMID